LGVASQKVSKFLKTTTIPASLVGEESQGDIIVEDLVVDLTDQIKDLPSQQVKRIKTQFCDDVIQEALLSCQ